MPQKKAVTRKGKKTTRRIVYIGVEKTLPVCKLSLVYIPDILEEEDMEYILDHVAEMLGHYVANKVNNEVKH